MTNVSSMRPMDAPSLAKVLRQLKDEGYTIDFNIPSAQKKYLNEKHRLSDFKIDKILRQEVASDPDDQSVVYAISSNKDESIKGVLVNNYGIYSDPKTDEIIEHLERPIDRP